MINVPKGYLEVRQGNLSEQVEMTKWAETPQGGWVRWGREWREQGSQMEPATFLWSKQAQGALWEWKQERVTELQMFPGPRCIKDCQLGLGESALWHASHCTCFMCGAGLAWDRCGPCRINVGHPHLRCERWNDARLAQGIKCTSNGQSWYFNLLLSGANQLHNLEYTPWERWYRTGEGSQCEIFAEPAWGPRFNPRHHKNKGINHTGRNKKGFLDG